MCGLFDNIVWLKPKKNFKKVIEEYGYPFISKEVSECVYEAKKYLTEVLQEIGSDRQTDRQTDSGISGTVRSTVSYAELASMQNPTRGGGDAKFRKLRGIGEYSKKGSRKKVNSQTSKNVGDSDNGQSVSDKGEHP